MDEQKPQTPAPEPVIQPPASVPLNPNQIYPEATHGAGPSAASVEDTSDRLDNPKADAFLQMAGVRHSAKSSRKVDAIGALMVLGGILQVLPALSHLSLVLAFGIVYVFVGVGIIMRSELARKVVVYFSVFSVLMSILGLVGILGSSSGRHALLSLISFLFSLVILVVVLSILTDPNIESEFS